MKKIITSLIIGFNIIVCKSFGQQTVNQGKNKADTTQLVSAKTPPETIPTRIYNDIPRMPKKKESANKLLRENRKEIKKGTVKRKYKQERRIEARLVKKRDNKHGIIAERKKKDRMFK